VVFGVLGGRLGRKFVPLATIVLMGAAGTLTGAWGMFGAQHRSIGVPVAR
jgi:hypothetical protein